jgi:hypothetical protein
MNMIMTRPASAGHSPATSANGPLAAELAAVATAVVAPFAVAEADFLAIGDRLAEASGILGRLTTLFEALPMQLDHRDMDDATAHFAEVAAGAAAMADALAGEHDTLTRLSASNAEVTSRIERLRATIGAISVLAVNARIEAAHIGTEGADFSVFTDSIGRLVRTAGATIERFSSEHGRLLELLKSASAKQAAFEQRHGESLRSVVRRLDAGLSSVAGRRALASAAVAGIGAKSRRIAQEIGAAVSGLQIGDITRQRAEHVAHALEMLALGLIPDRVEPGWAEPETRAEAADWSLSLTRDQCRIVISAVCQLQSAQLSHAADAFDLEVRQIVSALGELADSARDIVGVGAEVYGAAGQQDASFLTELGGEIRAVNELMAECGAARGEVDGVAAEAGASLKELLTQIASIRQIEVEMRLIGLNTILRCGRLGSRGRTLGVIAHELRGFANRTVEDAQGVIAALNAVTAGADTLTRGSRMQQADRVAALEQRTAVSLQRLENVGHSLNEALGVLQDEGARAAALLTATASGIGVHGDVCRVLRDGRNRLDRIAGPSPVDGEGVEMIRDRVLSLFHGRYTMASEREIHEMVFSAGAGGAEQAAAAEAVDDLLF